MPLRPGDVLWLQVSVGLYVPVALGSAAWVTWWYGWTELQQRIVGDSLATGMAVGVVLGLALVAGTRVASALQLLGELESTLRAHMGPLRPHTCVVLALTSSVGEELLFRGVLQPSVGWLTATLLFAVAHAPVDRGLSRWPLFALAAGGLFGGATLLTGGIVAPVVAHFIVNALNLMWLARTEEE